MKIKHIKISQLTENKHIFIEHQGHHPNEAISSYDCISIEYVAHSCGYYEFQNTQLPVSEGDIFIINPHIAHRFVPIAGIRRIDIYCCLFQPDIIKNQWNLFHEQFTDISNFFTCNDSSIRAVDTDNKEIRNIFIHMIDEHLNKPPCYSNALLGDLLLLLTTVFRNTVTKHFKRVYSPNSTVDDIIQYMNKHFYSRISLDDLAKRMQLSPSYVCRIFKKYTGMSTSQFINLLRIEKIKDILRNTNKPVDTIPEMFQITSDYVRQIFKQETGMSMIEYRNKYHYKNIID